MKSPSAGGSTNIIVKVLSLYQSEKIIMYVHIHNDQVFIFVKVTGGGTKLYRDSITTIASDITCKSLTELGAFLIKAELEIIKYIDNYKKTCIYRLVIGLSLFVLLF